MNLYQQLLKLTSLYAHSMTVDLALLLAMREIDEDLYLKISTSAYTVDKMLTMFLDKHNISLDKRRQSCD